MVLVIWYRIYLIVIIRIRNICFLIWTSTIVDFHQFTKENSSENYPPQAQKGYFLWYKISNGIWITKDQILSKSSGKRQICRLSNSQHLWYQVKKQLPHLCWISEIIHRVYVREKCSVSLFYLHKCVKLNRENNVFKWRKYVVKTEKTSSFFRMRQTAGDLKIAARERNTQNSN